MGYAGRFTGESGRLVRIPRADQSPSIDENLTANLFCGSTAILGDTSAPGGGNSIVEIQVRRMLC